MMELTANLTKIIHHHDMTQQPSQKAEDEVLLYFYLTQAKKYSLQMGTVTLAASVHE